MTEEEKFKRVNEILEGHEERLRTLEVTRKYGNRSIRLMLNILEDLDGYGIVFTDIQHVTARLKELGFKEGK